MSYLLIRHKVADYGKWKPVFDEHGGMRRANGVKGGHLFRNADDPLELLILFEVDDLGQSRRFVQSEDLRKAMEKAGVVDKPDVFFLEDIERLPG